MARQGTARHGKAKQIKAKQRKEKNLGEQRSDAKKTEKRVVISGYINGRAEIIWGSKNKMWRNHKKIIEIQEVI